MRTAAKGSEPVNQARSSWWKLVVLGSALGAVLITFHFTDAARYVTLTNIQRLREKSGAWTPIAFIVLYSVGTVAAFPGSLMSLTGGLLFGTVLGGTLIVLGATCGATAAFLLARYAGRQTVERFISGSELERFDHLIGGSGFSAVLFTRLVPLFPFNFINFAWGLTSVRLLDYVLSTAIGIIPGAFVYANLAGAVARSLAGTNDSLASVKIGRLLNPDVLVAFTMLGLLALIPILIKWWQSRSARFDKN